MPLATRNSALDAIAKEASRQGYRLEFKQQDGDGACQAIGPDGEILQQEQLDRFLPFGFWSEPPADTEQAILPCDGAEAAVGERITKPSAVPSNASSGTIYSAGGGYVQCKNGSDIEAEPEGGSTFNVGSTATAKMVLDGDVTTAGGGVGGMFNWISNVTAALNGILGPGTIVLPTNFGVVVGTSTKGKVE